MIIGICGKMFSGKDTVAEFLRYRQYCHNFGALSYESYLSMKSKDLIRITHFADKIKQCTSIILGKSREKIDDPFFKNLELGEKWKSYHLSEMSPNGVHTRIFSSGQQRESAPRKDGITYRLWERSMTPRMFMQMLGTEFGRNMIHPNIWVNSTLAEYTPGQNWIIADVRFPNEVKEIKNLGGIIVKIERPDHLRVPTVWESYLKKKDEYASWNDYLIENYPSLLHESETTDLPADYVIVNDSSLTSLKAKVLESKIPYFPEAGNNTDYKAQAKKDLKKIMKTVCEYYDMDLFDIRESNRKTKSVHARQVFAYIAEKLGYRIEDMTPIMHRDRTTVVYSVKKMKEILPYDKKTEKEIRDIIQNINLQSIQNQAQV
jgi:hypothetical protein